jgi:lactoylglutathione lyase
MQHLKTIVLGSSKSWTSRQRSVGGKFFLVAVTSLCWLGLLHPLQAQIPITGYNHVALAVDNIDSSVRFYRNIIGLEQIPVPEELKAIRAWFKIAPGQELHLLTGRSNPVSNNDRNGAHFSFSIPNADPVEDYLKKTGIPYHRQQRFDKAWQIYITDPDGYVIELNEPKKVSTH